MLNDVLFPGVITDNWQMMNWEKIGLTGVLSRLRPKGAIEVGVYYGGSLSLTSQYAEKIIAIDIDVEVAGRFDIPKNAELRIGSSVDLIPRALSDLREQRIPLNFALIDADHSEAGVKRDIELLLAYKPVEPLTIMMHDSGNPGTRRGILSADWASNPYVHHVDVDFIPGQIIEHSVTENSGEVWGGLALALLDVQPRVGTLSIKQGAMTSIRCLHHCCGDLTIVK